MVSLNFYLIRHNKSKIVVKWTLVKWTLVKWTTPKNYYQYLIKIYLIFINRVSLKNFFN